jgi:hypothetical protein
MLYTTLRFFTWRAFGFWTIMGLITNTFILAAFVLRLIGILLSDPHRSEFWHFRSFQLLACVSPFIWYASLLHLRFSLTYLSKDECVETTTRDGEKLIRM